MAYGSGKALLSLINQVLDLAKIEASKLELEASLFVVHAVLDDIVSLFSKKSPGKGIEFSGYISLALGRILGLGARFGVYEIITAFYKGQMKKLVPCLLYLLVLLLDCQLQLLLRLLMPLILQELDHSALCYQRYVLHWIFYNLRGAESLAARWFAKRFLHPDIVSIYDYAFLWDEDLGVEHFSPSRLYSSENEDSLKALKEKEKELSAPEPKPEPTTEVLFLCSYEGCRKTFIDAGALRKHSHIHGERQFVCHYEGCVKLKASKLKRHFLIHTGERDFVCPHEGCGKVGEAIPLSDASVDAVVGTLVLCSVKDVDLALKGIGSKE
ncbi:hypothetical protein Ahy_B06g083139 [Arachis hypogaea]|uniref:C2H2-type domain-containing protein n=1 Tax=Arachis hypogaea TaxID=3818 RepID=A0A444YPH9_ARAHY|nr:hypothetical protein Ahy_B06g083139 [Arachis hypogaea]